MRILVIDDDVELAGLLREFLQREGCETEFAHDGKTGLARATAGHFDLVVLDVMLPGLDGFEVLRRLRQTTRLPVVMLTARGDDVDRIVGLELGADDYLPKPFNPRELIARIRAVLRRAQPRTEAGRIEVNGVTLDPGTREVVCNGQPVDLTTIEFDILELLMRAAGRVLSRDQIMEALYSRKASPFDRAMDMHVSHLRKKLVCGGDKEMIKTVRGVGYQFTRSAGE
ncbi:MAG: response regulator transcription factor [Bryobacteraceae bacterium]|nr:response regulator transcription factor [Bryobacteraceae bacterium]